VTWKRTTTGLAICVLGSAILLTVALCEIFGLGASSAFGWKQVTAVILGCALWTTGFAVFRRANRVPEGNATTTLGTVVVLEQWRMRRRP
jgi:hypothetical protein